MKINTEGLKIVIDDNTFEPFYVILDKKIPVEYLRIYPQVLGKDEFFNILDVRYGSHVVSFIKQKVIEE